MIENIPNRLKNIRTVLDLTQKELADSLDVSLSMVGGIESRKQSMSLEFAQKMEEVHHVRAAWLTYGNGMPTIEEQVTFDKNSALKNLAETIVSNHGGQVVSKMTEIKYFPDIGASAGYGCLNGDQCESDIIYVDTKMFPNIKSYDRIDAIRAIGNSMEPTISDGDLLFVDKQKHEIVNGKIFIVRMGDEIFVKRIFFGIRDIIVKSDNPTHPQFNINPDEIDILGQVIYTMEYHG